MNKYRTWQSWPQYCFQIHALAQQSFSSEAKNSLKRNHAMFIVEILAKHFKFLKVFSYLYFCRVSGIHVVSIV